MEDTIIKKAELPIEFQSDKEIKELCLFLVKEIYGEYANSVELFMDVDTQWVLFIRDKLLVMMCENSLKQIYDNLLEEYEGYMLYSMSVRDQKQFKSTDLN